MRRARSIPSDPVRTTGEAIEAIVDLVVGALPSISEASIRSELGKISALLRYIVATEHTAINPLTLVAGGLVCDITTVHGEEAFDAEEPAVPHGATSASDWLLFVPLPEACPFDIADLTAAGRHLRPGPLPEAPQEAGRQTRGPVVLDADALRGATGR